MAFHEQRPWVEPQRSSSIHGHVILGAVIGLAVVIIGAILDVRIVAEVVGLAIFTLLVLAVGNWVNQRRQR